MTVPSFLYSAARHCSTRQVHIPSPYGTLNEQPAHCRCMCVYVFVCDNFNFLHLLFQPFCIFTGCFPTTHIVIVSAQKLFSWKRDRESRIKT